MSRTKKTHFIAWIGILLYGMLNFANFQGWVLCHENDGRVALELSINGVCNDSFQGEEKSASVQSGSEQTISCKRCIDVPFSLQNEKPALLKDQAHSSDLTTLASSRLSNNHIPAPVSYSLSPSLFPNPPPIKPPIHRVLGTVILII